MLLFSTHHLVLSKIMFMPIHLTGVWCHSAQVLFALSILPSLFNRSAVLDFFLTPCSIHSIVPEAVCCDFIKYLLILSSSYSIPFLFNRSAARSCSSLFLFSNGVFSTLFISVVFFSRNDLTFSRSFGFTRLSKKQLSFTSSLSLPFFPPVPF